VAAGHADRVVQQRLGARPALVGTPLEDVVTVLASYFFVIGDIDK
jgi:hypothetical protein